MNYSAFFAIRPSLSAVSNDGPPWITPNLFFNRRSCLHFDQNGEFGRDSSSRMKCHKRYDGNGAGSISGRGDDFAIPEPVPAVSNDAGSICCVIVSKPAGRNDLDVSAVSFDRCSSRRLPPPCSSFVTTVAALRDSMRTSSARV